VQADSRKGQNLKVEKPLTNDSRSKIVQLLNKGVKIPCPQSLEIGDEVDADRISGGGIRIFSGCKIFGAETLILAGTKLGYEAPVTVDNCQIGPDVELKGGFFKQAVFIGDNQAGLGSHVREATILEEQASIAHTVALKQTILFPFVTLGSLINFCDCLMAGGTSRRDHSEVGSSYIHFNYTPNQDKATASLIGDVPRGVMLSQRPIFLGGQGGMIGPRRLGYGITVAAGTILRKDELRSDRLIIGSSGKGGNLAFTPGMYRNSKTVVVNNIHYIANLMALNQWYDQVRRLFLSERFPEPLLDALRGKVRLALAERIKRLEAVCLKLPQNGSENKHAKSVKIETELTERWPDIKSLLLARQTYGGAAVLRDPFLESIQRGIAELGKNYISVIQALNPADADRGTRWLQEIIDDIIREMKTVIPCLF
jgi:UDP-N-acetylglucosamine/UDP-N-acetylgalactosamine diphosphorylase